MKILHITSHMGGGVGRALSDLIISDIKNENQILILQKPEKMNFIEKCMKHSNVKIMICPKREDTDICMQWADIVIIHWWHHPVMCKWLYDFSDVPVRLIIWSHVSGCTYPYLSFEFFSKFDYLLRTSDYTLENPCWNDMQRKCVEENSTLVYGLGFLGKMLPKKKYTIENETVKIGYVGTLAKSKLHPDFALACKKIIEKVPNVEFYLIGDIKPGKWLKKELLRSGIDKNVKFVGFVNNVSEWLNKMDIFGYPLNPYNFATTENSILEALATGLPVVLLNQGTEKYIINDGVDGLLADDIDQYADYIEKLAKDEQMRRTLGERAAYNVYKKYDFQQNLICYVSVLEKVMHHNKSKRVFKDVLGETPYNWFESAINVRDQEVISKRRWVELQPIFREESKSSIFHFAKCYPDDEKLQILSKELHHVIYHYESDEG